MTTYDYLREIFTNIEKQGQVYFGDEFLSITWDGKRNSWVEVYLEENKNYIQIEIHLPNKKNEVWEYSLLQLNKSLAVLETIK